MKYTFTFLCFFMFNFYFARATKLSDSCVLTSDNSLLPAIIDSITEEERSYTIGIDFGSNTSFNGVNQSNQQLYSSPNFTYTSKKGFYFYTAAYYLNDVVSHWDELDLNVGYDFNVSKKTFGSISYMKSFFSKISPQVNSSLTNNIQFYLKRKFWSIKTKLAFDYYFGDETDYYFTLSTSKSFTWYELFKGNDDLTITPKFRIVAGSQNFYYTKYSIVPPTKKKVKKGSAGQIISTEVSTKEFGIVSYIITIPVSYTLGKFTLEPAFNYSIGGNINPRPSRTYFTLSFYCTL